MGGIWFFLCLGYHGLYHARIETREMAFWAGESETYFLVIPLFTYCSFYGIGLRDHECIGFDFDLILTS